MIARRPTGGEVRGATPAYPLLFPVGHQDASLSQSPQQQLLDQRYIQRMFADGAIGGLWLPEPQYLFEDSAGTTAASTNGVCGLWLDCSRDLVLSPNFVVNGDFSVDSNWTKAIGWSISGGKARVNNNSVYNLSQVLVGFPLPSSTQLIVTYTISDYVSGGVKSYNNATVFDGQYRGAGIERSANGTYRDTLLSNGVAANFIFQSGASGANLSIDNVYLHVVLGTHALQATTANKPYLRRTPTSGKYWLDGNTATAEMTATFPSALSVPYTAAMGRRNLLTYSEQFNNAAWSKSQSTITENAILAPDGSMTADVLIPKSTSGTHPVYQNYTGTNATYTYSVYVKAKEISRVVLDVYTGTNDIGYIFDVSSGTAISPISIAPTSATITLVGDGWYRLTMAFTSPVVNAAVLPVISGTSYSFTGDGTSGCYLWGAQLEVGTSATPYQKITHGNTPCTVGRANADGVSFDTDANISTSYNLTPPYGYNSAVLIINRALTASETAVVARYLKGKLPIYANGAML